MKSTARYVLKDKTFKLDEKISLFKNFINQTENHILSLENRDRNGLTNRINDLKKYAKWLKRNILILNLRKVINEHIDSWYRQYKARWSI